MRCSRPLWVAGFAGAALAAGCNPILGIEAGNLRPDAGADGGAGGEGVSLGPTLDWARAYGDGDSQGGIRIAADSASNVYCLGDFRSSVPLSQDDVVPAVGGWDVLLLKLDSFGKLLWRIRVGGDGEEHGVGLAVDVLNGVLVTGSFQGMAGMAGLPLVGDELDQFVGRFGPDGSAKWVTSFGGMGAQTGVTFTSDAAGFYLSSQINGPINYGGGSHNPVAVDSFIGRLDPSLGYLWSEPITGRGNEHITDLAVDPSGSAYAVGAFDTNAAVKTVELQTAGLGDGFLFKLSSAGVPLWALAIGGVETDAITAADADDDGVVIAGYFTSSADIGGAELTGEAVTAFAARIDAGGEVKWHRVFDSPHDDAIADVAVDERGHVLLTGSTKGDLDLGGTTLMNSASGIDDAFVIELDDNGETVWGRLLGGTALDVGRGVAWTPEGSVLWTGMAVGPIDFGAGQLLEGSGGQDIIVAKFR